MMANHICPNWQLLYNQQETIDVWSDFEVTTLNNSEVTEYFLQ